LIFIKQVRSYRTVGKRSRDFELGVLDRLRRRITGSVHRVGHPRDVKKSKSDFNSYLKTLGFKRSVLLGQEKDGGFDILWGLPIGSGSHRPLVSVQCKNGEFSMAAADQSVGSATRSFGEHGGLTPSIHVPCVLFNDYITSDVLTPKAMNFVPLGLTDLGILAVPSTSDAI
jgi:hypothetical protein